VVVVVVAVVVVVLVVGGGAGVGCDSMAEEIEEYRDGASSSREGSEGACLTGSSLVAAAVAGVMAAIGEAFLFWGLKGEKRL
jgi:hypothetical protein